MFKKIIALLVGGVFSFSSMTQAQDFEFLFDNPAQDTTAGVTVYTPGDFNHDNVEIRNFIKNVSSDSFVVSWRYLDPDTTVTEDNKDTITDHWFVTGICDNIVCRGEFGPWYFGNVDQSDTIAPDSVGLLEVRIYAPVSSRDTTRIFKVEVTSPNQVDTAVYVLTKIGATGVSAVRLTDKQVSVYPNPLPAGQALNLYVDKQADAAQAIVYNIIGQQQLVLPFVKGKEIQSFNINNLPAGMYVLKVISHNGQAIVSRKFSKQ